MENLESEEEGAPRRVLYFKPMSWLGQIRPHRRDEAWSASLWQTFFASCVGANIPALAELPLSACGCRKFQIDTLGDHLCTCTAQSGVKKDHESRMGDYNNNPPNAISFMTVIAGTSGRLHSEFVRRLLLQAHRDTDRFQVLQLQEFSFPNMTVDCSKTAARCSPHSSSLKWAAPSSRLQLYE